VADVIQVDDPALQALAAHCDAVACELTGTVATLPLGPPGQATTAAVHNHVITAAGILAGRVGSTGAKLSSTDALYVAEDERNAQRIDAVGRAAGA
jgi:hypothetical protein